MRREARDGLVLIGAALAALIAANSALAPLYHRLLAAPLGPLDVVQWIDEGLMTAFFFLVGLEVKRAFVLGELRHRGARILPLAAAGAGMVVPALTYLLIAGGSDAARGWAIPAATDIAFAQAMLGFSGRGVPPALRLFLMTAAIVDDIGAVAIIAVAYSTHLDFAMLALAGAIFGTMLLCARCGVMARWPYAALTMLLWAVVLRSGVHATVAGVLGALAVPVIGTAERPRAPAAVLEHRLAPWVAGIVVPLFGFAHVGLDLRGVAIGDLSQPIPLGIMLGLIVGKPIGFGIGALAAIRSGLARMPAGARPLHLLGVALLAGIGFTMSLFIGGLAFGPRQLDAVRLGVLGGSVVSAIAGIVVLRLAGRRSTGRSG